MAATQEPNKVEEDLTTLYNLSVLMSEAGDSVKDKHEEQYKNIIECVKSSDTRGRILAAQLIARFFKYFPAYEESAFDSIVDLCESVDVDVRKHAAIAMIAICKDCKHLVSKAADILIQLYQTNQASEVNLINQSLTTLLNLDIQKFLQSFFTNFEDGTEVVRERALKFLSTKILTVSESALTKEVEEQLLTYSKKAMEDVTKDEFLTFVGLLTKLKIAKTATGQAMIVLVIKSQAELSKDFDVNDADSLDKFLLCTRHTIPLLSQYNRASEYINYICLKILPHLKELAAKGGDLNVLQALAEMSPHVHADKPELIDLEKCQQAVYEKLLEYLPAAQRKTEEPATTEVSNEAKPAEAGQVEVQQGKEEEEEQQQQQQEQQTQQTEEAATEQAVEKKEIKATPAKNQEVDFQFTHIEYLLYTFHQFGRLRPEFFTESILTEIKLPFLHLNDGCKRYMDLLSAQEVKSGNDLNEEANKLRSVALRTTKNISILVRDFYQKNPTFKSNVLLSCKTPPNRPVEATKPSPTTVSTNNNNSNRPNANRGQQQRPYNNGSHNKQDFNRQAGQKHKYRQSYSNDRNKRPRHAR